VLCSAVRLRLMIGCSSLGWGKRFFSAQNLPHHLWDPTKFLFSGYRCHFSGRVKWRGREVDYSNVSGYDIKNDYVCSATTVICLHDVEGDYLMFVYCIAFTIFSNETCSKIVHVQ